MLKTLSFEKALAELETIVGKLSGLAMLPA